MSPDGRPSATGGGRLFNSRAVGAGAAMALAVAVPTIVVASVAGIGPDSSLVFIPFLVYLAGQSLGGWRAARREPDAPLSNGAAAALLAVVLILSVASAVRVIRGRNLDPESLILNTFLAASAGIFGGLIASRRPPPEAGTSPEKRSGRRSTP